ncbi:MAG: acyl-CoA dehydrogenase family protein [Niveispirillum sp.]|uniref:acyl-CoA dehydrogenase family protein n=1 Tax=Niveispirillum sp. TaxID=1917217 RepID=UPI003BA438B3
MDFNLSEDQTLLKDSVLRFVADRYSFDDRRRYVTLPQGFDAANWATFAELGWLMLPFAEADGGLGGTPIDLMVLFEALGRGLVVEPYLPSILLSGGLIAGLGNGAQKERYLPGLMEGRLLAATACMEAGARFNLADVTCTARPDGGGWVLDGAKSLVLNGDSASLLLIPARTGGDRRDSDGISLFLVDGAAAGVTRRAYPTLDGGRAADITLSCVRVGADEVLGPIGGAYPALSAAVERATLALCAEAVGAMDVLLWSTVDYARTREQFDQPIGKFQVIQHRLVDLYIEYEQSRSLLLLAAMRLTEGGVAGSKALSALKVQVGKAGRFIGQQAVQLHGGMGMTDELNIGHYFKRLTAIDALFGNVDHHLKRFASLA